MSFATKVQVARKELNCNVNLNGEKVAVVQKSFLSSLFFFTNKNTLQNFSRALSKAFSDRFVGSESRNEPFSHLTSGRLSGTDVTMRRRRRIVNPAMFPRFWTIGAETSCRIVVGARIVAALAGTGHQRLRGLFAGLRNFRIWKIVILFFFLFFFNLTHE